VWEVDTHFIHTYLSPRIFDVLGYRPEELIGKSPADIMPEDERKRAMPIIRGIIAKKDKFIGFQTAHVHKDGRHIIVETNGKPFYNPRGKLMGYRGSARDITDRKKMLDDLMEREIDLIAKSKNLEDVNSALRVLLKQRDDDKIELEQRFVSNVREMILPYVEKLQRRNLEIQSRAYVDIIASNLDQLTSPFIGNVRHLNFTPREIEVANLIRDGNTTKEITDVIGVAPSAVHSHRDNIRKKLGLTGKTVNLMLHLQDLKQLTVQGPTFKIKDPPCSCKFKFVFSVDR
jgi:PAS domain S-box-containing protein